MVAITAEMIKAGREILHERIYVCAYYKYLKNIRWIDEGRKLSNIQTSG